MDRRSTEIPDQENTLGRTRYQVPTFIDSTITITDDTYTYTNTNITIMRRIGRWVDGSGGWSERRSEHGHEGRFLPPVRAFDLELLSEVQLG